MRNLALKNPVNATPVPTILEYVGMRSLQPEESQKIRDYLYKHAGILMTDQKKNLIENRLRKRLGKFGFETFDQYYNYLIAHDAELQNFLDALTTNETYFYREEKHWDFFRDVLLKELKNRKADDKSEFSVWSAASSTGEELYTAAIELKEYLGNRDSRRWRLFGSDINATVVAAAESGVFNEYALHETKQQILDKYFREDNSHRFEKRWEIDEEVKSLCRFELHNLCDELSQRSFDVIFCRNVFIYFDKATKEKIVKNLVSKIKPGGYLIFSHTESTSTRHPDLEPIQPSVFRKR